MDLRIPARPLMGGRFLLGGEARPLRGLGQAAIPGCNIPAGYGPNGRAVVGCSVGNGLYNVLDATSGAPLMSSVSSDCLKQFGNFTIAPPGDSRCNSAGSASLDPCGISADLIYKPLLACPGPSGYSIIDPATNTIVLSGVSQACLANFKSLTISTASDPRCVNAKPAPPSIVSNPGARMVTFPLAGMQFPWSGEPAPIAPVAKPKTVYDVATPNPVPAPQPPVPTPAPTPAFVSNTPIPAAAPQTPPPNYPPGQAIPVSDWFGICKKNQA